MRVRLFHNPFWQGEPTGGDVALTRHLERVGVAGEQIGATISALDRNTEAEIDCPDGVDLRDLAENMPNLTIELID